MKPGQQFLALARETMAKQNCTWDQAWQRTAQANPELHSQMMAGGKTKQAVQMANTREANRSTSAKIQARNSFISTVHEYMDANGVDYATAFTRCQRTHANFFNEMSAPATPSRVFNAGQAALLRLSALDQEEANAAFQANNNQFSPVDYQAVFDGVVSYWMGKKSLSKTAAEEEVKTRHPQLTQYLSLLKTNS